jgi:hypothetical protein
MSTGHGDVPLHRNYGTNARYAVPSESKLSTSALTRAVARGPKPITVRPGSIQDTRNPPHGHGHAPGTCPVTPRIPLEIPTHSAG